MAKLPTYAIKEGQEVVAFMTDVAIAECISTGIFEFEKGVSLKAIAVTGGKGYVVVLVLRAGCWLVKKITGKDITSKELAGVVVVGSILAPFAASGLLISAVMDAFLPSNDSRESSYDSDYDNDHSPGSWNSFLNGMANC